jgi:hypothetical protein
MLWHCYFLAFKSFFCFANVDHRALLVVTMVDKFPFAVVLGLLTQPIEADVEVEPQKFGSFGSFALFI